MLSYWGNIISSCFAGGGFGPCICFFPANCIGITRYDRVNYPKYFMMAPLAMVRGIPATVPTASEIPIVNLVEPRSWKKKNTWI